MAADRSPDRLSELATDVRVLIGKLRRKLREQVPPADLTWPQMGVLGQLERNGPATVTALARAEGVRPQSMGATVAALEEAGMLAGAPDPADGRQTIWSPTDACRALIVRARDAREDWLVHALDAKLTPDEQHDLERGVRLLARLLEP